MRLLDAQTLKEMIEEADKEDDFLTVRWQDGEKETMIGTEQTAEDMTIEEETSTLRMTIISNRFILPGKTSNKVAVDAEKVAHAF